MAKLLSFSDESRGALEKGVNNLANALKVTIGPKGRNVVIEKKFGAPGFRPRIKYSWSIGL